MEMADILVNEGYRELGYNIISLDDCWLDRNRDAQGRLQPDPHRFPSGIKALGEYVSIILIFMEDLMNYLVFSLKSR